MIDQEQQAAYRHVLGSSAKTQLAILDAIAMAYPKLTRKASSKTDRKGLRGLISLRSVNIHDVARAGVAYVGYVFGCTWEEEHGLGVMTHLDRIVAVGAADTAILTEIAEKDRRRGKKKSR